MPRPLERVAAVLCYLGAMRVPIVALVIPEWAFTVPTGLLFAGLAWAYGAQRSPFLLHHGREGVKWAVQANLLLVLLSLLAKGLYYLWFYTGITATNTLWHFSAMVFRWTGVLVSVLTLLIMFKARRGLVCDALSRTP